MTLKGLNVFKRVLNTKSCKYGYCLEISGKGVKRLFKQVLNGCKRSLNTRGGEGVCRAR